MKNHTEAEKLQAAYNVIDRATFKLSNMESVPEKLIKYLIESFEDSAKIHGKIKRTAAYGGSAFVIFEDNECYRLTFQLYDNKVTTE